MDIADKLNEEYQKHPRNVMVSIVCITYNHAQYIEDALKGFLEQKTNFEYEIIIHDDASTDETQLIIKKYAELYPDKIVAILQDQNQRSLHNPITLPIIRNARGKYIAVCEGDDYWIDDNKLQMQVDILENKAEYSASQHNAIVVDEQKNPLKINDYRWNENTELSYKDLYNKVKLYQTATILFRTELFRSMSAEQFNELCKVKCNGDVLWCAVFVANGKIYHIAKDMSCYRKSINSWTAKHKNTNISLLTLNQLSNVQEYIEKYYNLRIDYSGNYKYLGYDAIECYMKDKSSENYSIMKEVMQRTEYSRFDYYLMKLWRLGVKLFPFVSRIKNKLVAK